MNAMIIADLLQILLIIIAAVIVISKDNLQMVVFFAVFSLVTASLYYFNQAPDVALAEVAIGSAIMPLIFIISISRQREFIVISHVNDEFLSNHTYKIGKGYELLSEFTRHYGLKLKIYKSELGSLKGIFRSRNVDLIVEKCPSTHRYLLKGKESSILMNKLEQMTENEPLIEVIKIREGETDD